MKNSFFWLFCLVFFISGCGPSFDSSSSSSWVNSSSSYQPMSNMPMGIYFKSGIVYDSNAGAYLLPLWMNENGAHTPTAPIIIDISNWQSNSSAYKVEWLFNQTVVKTVSNPPSSLFSNQLYYGWGIGNIEVSLKIYFSSGQFIQSVNVIIYPTNYSGCSVVGQNRYRFILRPKEIFYRRLNPPFAWPGEVIDAYLSGSFNSWALQNPSYKMDKIGDSFVIILSNLSTNDTYKYQFLTTNADGSTNSTLYWTHDLANPRFKDNGVGTFNSYVNDSVTNL